MSSFIKSWLEKFYGTEPAEPVSAPPKPAGKPSFRLQCVVCGGMTAWVKELDEALAIARQSRTCGEIVVVVPKHKSEQICKGTCTQPTKLCPEARRLIRQRVALN